MKTMRGIAIGAVVGLACAFALAALADVATQGGTQNVGDWWVTAGAHRSCTFAEVVVTNAAGGTTITAVTRKAIDIFNGGPNTIYCRFDGGTPSASTAGGRPILANASFPVDVTSAVVIKCIAATAAQVTTAATAVTQCL